MVSKFQIFTRIFLFLLLVSARKALSTQCSVGTERRFSNSFCGEEGCAGFQKKPSGWSPAQQQYSSPRANNNYRNVGSSVEHLCMSDLIRLHPFFALAKCPWSSSSAACFDDKSLVLIDYTSQQVGVLEQTVGEVLRLHNIQWFCCCQGDNCNSANMEMQRQGFNYPNYMGSGGNGEYGGSYGVTYGMDEGIVETPYFDPHAGHKHHKHHGHHHTYLPDSAGTLAVRNVFVVLLVILNLWI
uniref:Uncharacterized protein n=1 Tax=Ditylenchus dipsaci TaxID=166011 RepID=A0A915CY51_9BILA